MTLRPTDGGRWGPRPWPPHSTGTAPTRWTLPTIGGPAYRAARPCVCRPCCRRYGGGTPPQRSCSASGRPAGAPHRRGDRSPMAPTPAPYFVGPCRVIAPRCTHLPLHHPPSSPPSPTLPPPASAREWTLRTGSHRPCGALHSGVAAGGFGWGAMRGGGGEPPGGMEGGELASARGGAGDTPPLLASLHLGGHPTTMTMPWP